MAQYSIITAPAGGVLSLNTLKALLRIDLTDTTEDALLNLFMSSAQSAFERYAGLVLQTTTFKMTDQIQFLNDVITIGKSPVTSFTSVKAFDGIAFVATDFEGVNGYNAHVHLTGITQSLTEHTGYEIVFVAGLASIPDDLKLAMYQHSAYLYENRGDCPVNQLPPMIKNTYDSYMVLWI